MAMFDGWYSSPAHAPREPKIPQDLGPPVALRLGSAITSRYPDHIAFAA
jgi:hypothetical protein